jgi:hypothetical protein
MQWLCITSTDRRIQTAITKRMCPLASIFPMSVTAFILDHSKTAATHCAKRNGIIHKQMDAIGVRGNATLDD